MAAKKILMITGDYGLDLAALRRWPDVEDPTLVAVDASDRLLLDLAGELAGHLEGLAVERRVNNNIVLKKLRIAFSLKTDDILAILTQQKFRVSMPEITAMMRAPDHKNFRECGDQFLRYFLRGLTEREHAKS